MNKNDLSNRTKLFAIRVFKFTNRLPKSKATDVISYQLLKAASSVAANYRASGKAKSRDDFSNKMKIVLEEADESNFWLTFIKDLELLKNNNDNDKEESDWLIQESSELIAIFTKSVKTLSMS